MRTLVVPLLVAAACKQDAPAPSAPVASTPRPAPAPTSAAPPAGDAAFRAGTTELAAARGFVVQAWGSAELDDVPGPDPFAQLGPDPDHGNAETGAYLVQGRGAVVLVQLLWDGRTTPWQDVAAREVPWKASSAASITHRQSHRGGFEETSFAIRRGELVVLRTASQEDARSGDRPVETDYADATSACATPCPAAAERGFTVIRAGTLAELADALGRR